MTYLTTAQVADRKGVSQQTAKYWAREGHLPAIKAGRDWLVLETDLDRFVPPRKGPKAKTPGL